MALGACRDEVPRYGEPAFGRDPAPIGALNGRIVTSNSGDDTLSVVDPATPAPAKRLPVGFSPVEIEGPHHLAADPAGRFLYLNLSFTDTTAGSGPHGAHGAGTVPGYVVKLDAATGREVARAQVAENPGDNALSFDGKTLFVTHYDLALWSRGAREMDLRKGDSDLVALDTERMTIRKRVPLCPAAHGVRLSRDGGALYATCGPDEIAVVDLRDPAWPVRRVLLPEAREGATCQRCPYALDVAPDGTVWVSGIGTSGARGGLDVYDPATGAFDPARSVVYRGAAMFPAFAPAGDGYRAYVPEQGPATGDFLHVYENGSAGEPLREVETIALPRAHCTMAHMMIIAADTTRAHLVCEGDRRGPGTLVWLDLARGAVLGSVPIGVFPDGLVLVPERSAP